ncbi:hypothetical protein [Sporosarcina sp. NPDC096371]|uniref:hypothetical protein n=1 Tax=Sporosarcina sp. NPDC096371 TaxID=3364530 RepID=UPI00381D8614
MFELIIGNWKILFITAFVWLLVSRGIIPILRMVDRKIWRGKKEKFLRNWYVRNAIFVFKYLVLLGMIVALIDLQKKFGFINLGEEKNSLSLVIAILTMYGILYTFIQFMTGYADQKENDKHWGESTIVFPLTRNSEFVFFHSRHFKFLLLYCAVFPLVNLDGISLTGGLMQALWVVSMTIVYVLYLFLFTKSLFIMKHVFSMQKSPDMRTKRKIEREKLEEYEILFEYSYREKNDYFVDVLFKDVMSIGDSERKDMFKDVFTETLCSFSEIQYEKIDRQRNRNPTKSKETNGESYSLFRRFSRLYVSENLKKLDLNFDELLSMYRLTEKVLYNEVDLETNGDHSKLMIRLVDMYTNGQGYFEECTYYQVPQVIWDQVQSNADVLALHSFVETKEASRIDHEVLNEEAKSRLELLVQSENKYIWKLLDQSKEYLEEFKRGRYLFNQRSHESVKNNIYKYILSLEFTDENKAYIEVLMDVLDYKYRVAIVFYIMLYPSETDFIKKQQDILFFRYLLNKFNGNQQISDSEVKEFVLRKIGNSTSHHRIDQDLLEWIFDNLETRSTDVRLIQTCLDWHDFSYAKLLMFKFIFNENLYCYPDFSELANADVEQFPKRDWRVACLKDMLQTPSLLKEEFYWKHAMKLAEHVRKTSTPVDFYSEDDFRLYCMDLFFEMSEVQFLKLLQETRYLRRGIIEFLVLKLDKAAYDYLITNDWLSKEFARRLTQIIYQENLDIESYVNYLAERANEVLVDSPVPQLKKDKIVRKLTQLIIE